MDVRLERAVRTLAAQGVDPRGVNVDWVSLRRRQHDRAVEDVKAELLLDRIATAENIEATDEDVDREIAVAVKLDVIVRGPDEHVAREWVDGPRRRGVVDYRHARHHQRR